MNRSSYGRTWESASVVAEICCRGDIAGNDGSDGGVSITGAPVLIGQHSRTGREGVGGVRSWYWKRGTDACGGDRGA